VHFASIAYFSPICSYACEHDVINTVKLSFSRRLQSSDEPSPTRLENDQLLRVILESAVTALKNKRGEQAASAASAVNGVADDDDDDEEDEVAVRMEQDGDEAEQRVAVLTNEGEWSFEGLSKPRYI
jgi:hypothetical protein